MSDRDSSSSSSSSSTPPPRTPYDSTSSIRPPTSSLETLHPLLAPIAHLPPPSPASHPIAPPVIPEKCLTFCSQRSDAPPLCRMLCLRRRAKVLSRGEELARLKGRDIKKERAEGVGLSQGGEAGFSASSIVNAQSGPSREPMSFNPFAGWMPTSWNPFAALQRAVDPYSIVYVRGTPDGVVGRYMEEMEYDDGNRDFGETISRHAKPRGREERAMEYLDWGDEGALLHLPLSSVFHPVTSIPNTLRTIFRPSLGILSLYYQSFTDGNGAQTRGAQKFYEAATNLDAITFLGKVQDHHKKMVKERYDKEVERQKEVQKLREAEVERRKVSDEEGRRRSEGFTATTGEKGEGEEKRYQSEIDRLRTGTGGSALRRKIEEAMERDEEFRRSKAANGAGTAGKGESGVKPDDA